MSWLQRIAGWVVDAPTYAEMKAEPERWRFVCRNGHDASIWDTGGIRYKASGTPLLRLKCPNCGDVSVVEVSKQEPREGADSG